MYHKIQTFPLFQTFMKVNFDQSFKNGEIYPINEAMDRQLNLSDDCKGVFLISVV